MAIGYPITYGDNLTEDESSQHLKSVYLGTMFVIILYSSIAQAHASDLGLLGSGTNTNNPNGLTEALKQVAHKQITDTQKGTLSGAAATICGLAVSTGDFWISVACGVVVILAMRVVNKN